MRSFDRRLEIAFGSARLDRGGGRKARDDIVTAAFSARGNARSTIGESRSHVSDSPLVQRSDDTNALELEAAASMSRLERLAQRSGVDLAAQEIERLLARRPEANAAEALSAIRGLAQELSFTL